MSREKKRARIRKKNRVMIRIRLAIRGGSKDKCSARRGKEERTQV